MWFQRNRPKQDDLPAKCFISHAYRDAEAREQLLQTLPKSVDPVIFPPITVSPDQLVTHLTQMNVNGEDRSTLRSHIRTMRVSA